MALSIWEENIYGKKKETDKVGAFGQVFHVAVSLKMSKGFQTQISEERNSQFCIIDF